MIDVLIVDDSPVVRAALRAIIESDPDMRVAGEAHDGRAALAMVHAIAPHVVVMDFRMPVMDGLEATRLIMQERPTPIVIVSGVLNPEEVAENFKALEAGALALMAKPRLVGDAGIDTEAMASVARTVRLMSDVPVVRRRPLLARGKASGEAGLPGGASLPRASCGVSDAPAVPLWPTIYKPGIHRLLAVRASTGGPQALRALLAGLHRDFPVPVLVVQHIAKGFLPGLVEWLDMVTPLNVRIAVHGETCRRGTVYFAPDNSHMMVDDRLVVRLSDSPPVEGLKPAVSVLFDSVADTVGCRGVGVLLTGMGRDGAAGLAHMAAKGALTIAQDKASSIVHGMPGAAIKLRAARHVLALDDIASFLAKTLGCPVGGGGAPDSRDGGDG
ncbi:MAG: chemotaxis-specific protein-glutamate methyltransferase CheB [Desulfovibrionaceae bacterium]